ncbi:MAG: hypothetical protein FD123_3766 [Bacteroidetes bacterium]|nr:MAG: hypothetical protein FD123_3766 [Bacteroidota bacterium]
MFAGLTQGTPYLDAYYRWMVLDHLTLSGSKTDMLRRVFCGSDDRNGPRFFSRLNAEKDSLVKIKDQRVSSVYDPAAKLWKTTLDLQIENTDTASEFRRTYSTVFTLPDGCWISDYYLVVGDQKKKGILAEKKAATWVFTEIVRRAQDPGLLRYRDDGKIDFRVFPFSGGEIRQTGITFSHIEPFVLDMDSLRVQLGDPAKNNVKGIQGFPGSSMQYVSKEAKQKLKLVTRDPAYYFIVDASAGNSAKMSAYAERIRQFEKEHNTPEKKDVVAAANYRAQSWEIGEAWTEGLSAFPCEGGFNLENAMRRLLAEHFSKTGNDRRPVFIVVSDSLDKAIYTRPLTDMRFIMPESDSYYLLDKKANLVPQSIGEAPVQQTAQSKVVIVSPPVHEYNDQSGKTHYLPADSSGSFVFSEVKEPGEIGEGTTLENALKLEAAARNLVLHPEQTEAEWLDIVRGSFKTRLLSSFTVYIVVETEAQEKALLEKQKQTMSSKKSLDASEDEFQMSEPSLWILLGLLLAVFFVRKRFTKSQA